MYSLTDALSPYGDAIKYYLIETRPRADDTVIIVAVVCFQSGYPLPCALTVTAEAVQSMRAQMENDLRDQAAEIGAETCYWDYAGEVRYDNP